jgi:uncharacterized membrane protein YccC
MEIFKKVTLAQLTKPDERIGMTGAQVLEHSLRTAVTAVASMVAAQLFTLPQSYWAPITTLVITQSSLGSTLSVSWQRFIGTALGAAVGASVAIHFGPHMPVFGASIFLLGLFCAVVHADRSAYRFGGVTLAIVLLLPRTEPAWLVAFHRFAEVSIGIAVALAMTVVWPERSATSSKTTATVR